MNEIVNEVLPIVQSLISGFVATAIFYWLADVIKPSHFERVLQALICTGVIQVLVESLEALCLFFGRWYSFGHWTTRTGTAWSVTLAVMMGLTLAFLSQHDALYRVARRLGFTSKASVSEWTLAFSRNLDQWVVLHMKDGRRLMGYPDVWPVDPQVGHFLMGFPAWLVEGEIIEVQDTARLLVANADVQWVEFLKSKSEADNE